jgi:hypothetical protein
MHKKRKKVKNLKAGRGYPLRGYFRSFAKQNSPIGGQEAVAEGARFAGWSFFSFFFKIRAFFLKKTRFFLKGAI